MNVTQEAVNELLELVEMKISADREELVIGKRSKSSKLTVYMFISKFLNLSSNDTILAKMKPLVGSSSSKQHMILADRELIIGKLNIMLL